MQAESRRSYLFTFIMFPILSPGGRAAVIPAPPKRWKSIYSWRLHVWKNEQEVTASMQILRGCGKGERTAVVMLQWSSASR